MHNEPNRTGDDAADLAGLSPLLKALSRRGEVRRYRRGAVLIREGEMGQSIFIILSGRLRAYSTHALGDKEITYGVYGAGDYVGEISLDGGPRSASVDALENTSCAVVSRRTIELFIAEHPSFAFELLAKVSRLAREATLSAKQMALEDVYGRLRRHLLTTAVADGDGTSMISPRPTHKAIAQVIGCGREMVSRLIKQLERGGYVQQQPAGLRILRALPPRY